MSIFNTQTGLTKRGSLKQHLKTIPWINRANAKLKALIHEYKAAAELRHYRRTRSAAVTESFDSSTIGQAVRKKLSDRGVDVTPKSKGDLHIFLAYTLYNWEAVLPRALEPFGLITEFEWRSRGFDGKFNKSSFESNRKVSKEMLDAFYQSNDKRPVDVVVGYLTGYMTDPSILQKMGKAGAVILNFSWDDKLGFRDRMYGGRWSGPAALAAVVDLNLTNAPESCLKYDGEGGLAMFWPEGAHPDIHKPYEVPFEFDVSFVGKKYGWRPRFIEQLPKKGINITCFGSGWDNGKLSDEEMVKLYSRSRINLGFAGVGHSKKLMCLKGRDFEVPMSGGLYLTQDNPELSLVYDVGREIMTYRNEEDCIQKISYLLANPDMAANIRIAGRKRALDDHTWENRFDNAFRYTGIMA
ncbi:glycosyltransferase [Thermodesulfobacteriota bacterium]